MGNSSASPGQIISLPKGGGAQHGLGEKFSPDLHTGTGNFTVPIALPPGRNGFQPQLNLVYSTGNGNGIFGLGWGLSIPGVTRKTAKGIPRYQDYDKDLKERDTFILSGAEDLVPIKDLDSAKKTTLYRPRTEGLFAKIIHHHDAQASTNFWEVCSKDGLTSYYGLNPADNEKYHRDFENHSTPATITKPNDPDRVFAWKLTLTKDPFGNRIEYLYENRDHSKPNDEQDAQDKDGHQWDQPVLTQIRYVDYKEGDKTKFLVTVTFKYDEDDRPDPFSDYRSGFEIRTTKRCKSILIETHADQEYKVRRYDFTYTPNELNKVSLLTAINVVGFDDNRAEAKELPPLEFGYTDFNPQDQKRRDFYPVQGADLPATSLGNSSMELVDLFGNGLPDFLEMNGTVRYWRNLGNGQFDIPRPMTEAPAGVALADPGVQIIDANGDGRPDLLNSSGYYPLQFGGLWDRRSFQKYQYGPSFDLKDPEVRLMDLTGDGVTDVIRSGTRLECFFNDPREGWKPGNTRWVERQSISDFPNVTFSDPRVKWADMSGDGLQDIVLVYDGNLEYWPNLGYGNWGKRLHMKNSPRFPFGYDPKRILVGDVDGDGLADVIYVDDRKIHLWINQSGNSWSEEIIIQGTPPVSDMDAVRLADLLGSGISGVLWTRDATSSRQDHYLFLDLTGGMKPYLLNVMDNKMGAVTKVGYAPSTRFCLEDEKKKKTHWKTPLPFPVQVVARVEVVDEFSRGKLTTEYRYHHGYWDGAEREFRGFGMVEQFDTEIFADYHQGGLHGDPKGFQKVTETHFSSPTCTKTWFHQGPVGEEFGEWDELDFSEEYWTGDPQLLNHTEEVKAQLKNIGSTYSTLTTQQQRKTKRDALRTLRGSILRTELYALDGSPLQEKPYTVTEHAYGLKEIDPPPNGDRDRLHIFFPHSTAERTTQWERGDDPMTQLSFKGMYDDFGQALSQTAVALPRRKKNWIKLPYGETHVLATHSRTAYADAMTTAYIYDRVARTTSFELKQPPELTETKPNDVQSVLKDQREAAFELHNQFETDLENWKPEGVLSNHYRVFAHTVNHYDGDAYKGLDVGHVGKRGALTLTETVVFTDETRTEAYGNEPLIDGGGKLVLPAGAPAGFSTDLGYRHVVHEEGYVEGFYAKAQQQKFDFHESPATGVGLVVAQKDPLGHETRIIHDKFGLLPETVKDPIGLETKATYNYRVIQPETVTDPNDNVTEFKFSPIGLLTKTYLRGKLSRNNEGDRSDPSTELTYDFLAYHNSKLADPENPKPIFVRTVRRVRHDTDPEDTGETIETREYSDGFGRLLQTRTQGEELRYGDKIFGGGDGILPADQNNDGRNRRISGRKANATSPNVTVSGWQRYDNKGRVVEKFEPFFDVGWDYDPPEDEQLGEKARMFYDPRGQVVRTLNPDGSEQRVIYGVPISIKELPSSVFETTKVLATPWEAFTYDPNDLAPVSYDPKEKLPNKKPKPLTNRAPEHCRFTPSSILIDGLGRTVITIQRNRESSASENRPIDEYRTRTAYDIQGNLLVVTDPLDRKAFIYVYDLSKRVLRIKSIDAGTRCIVLDAAGNEVQRNDSKGAIILREYDILNRPLRLWARDNDKSGQDITLREQLEYGDESIPNQTDANRASHRNQNRLGKLAQHNDEAGLLKFEEYDFKGNLLEKTRTVISDTALAGSWTANWSKANAEVDLDTTTPYVTSTQFDALNRPKQINYPADVNGDPAKLKPIYNRAGALEQVLLDADMYVQHIAYNAKGQRVFIAYGNSVITRYAYDPQTFRLKRLRTEYFSRNGDNYQTNGTVLQDFGYDYDLAGNILKIRDRTPKSGTPADPDKLDREFTYDALYRLLSATGRECDSANPTPPWDDTVRGNDPTKTRPYTQTYTYDNAGNMTELGHKAPTRPAASFSRRFTIVPANNRLRTMTVGGEDYTYTYDDNGNMKTETTSRNFEWDYADRLKSFGSTDGVASTSLHAQYLYDAAGQRVKKFVRNQQDQSEVTVYIDGIFEYHEWPEGGQPQSNNRLHVMDNQSRIAIVRVGDDDDQKPQIQYQLGDHLGSSNVVVGGASAIGNTVINREEFFPYGETSFGNFARKQYRFTGQEREGESGLNYHRARYYAPWLGRWMSCDPVQISSKRFPDINPSAYAKNSPLHFIDRLGRDIHVLPESKLKAEEIVAAIHGSKNIPDYMKRAINLSKDKQSIHVAPVPSMGPSSAKEPVPEWFESLIQASAQDEWDLTTASAVVFTDNKGTTVNKRPDIKPERKIGMRGGQGDRINSASAFWEEANELETHGYTFAHEEWKLALGQDPDKKLRYDAGSGKSSHGLVVIVNRIIEIKSGADAGSAERKVSADLIALSFLHEVAVHAGRQSGPTATELKDKALMKRHMKEIVRMPSSHKDEKVNQWSDEILLMFGLPPQYSGSHKK